MKKSNYVGDKNIFAVEYSIFDGETIGYNRVWIGGTYIGSFDDSVYLSYLQGGLKYISDNKSELKDFPCRDEDSNELLVKKALNMKEEGDDRIDKYIMQFGESFDDFLVICFIDNGVIYFVWKLLGKHYFEYPNYSNKPQRCSVGIDYFEDVVNKFYLINNK